MGKEKEIYIRWGEMCTREEGRERNTYIYSRGGGGGMQQDLRTKLIITTSRPVIEVGFFPQLLHRKTEEKYNQKKSIVV